MISFYSDRDVPYGGFSNFSAHGFELDGKWWRTSEHYFQAQKFVGTPWAENIREVGKPKDAANMGRDRRHPLRPDWEQVKEEVMMQALRAKFAAHVELRRLLLETGEEPIVENAPGDYYWGCGADGGGQNRLGHLLMELRRELSSTDSDATIQV
jgi:ribA/ribD-fused uncharacterized protein